MKPNQMKESTFVSPLLVFLIVLFVAFLMMSNILANQMLTFWIWAIDAGTLTFPITYMLSDVFSEVYGYKWSRRVTWYAAGMNLLFALLIQLAIHLPQPDWYDGSHFQLAIGGSFRIVIASIISYVCGDFVNDRIFRFMKKSHPGLERFKFRAIASSLGGECVDTTIFVIIAFSFVIPVDQMLPMIVLSIFLKTGYEAAILPVTSKVAKIVHAQEDKFQQRISGGVM